MLGPEEKRDSATTTIEHGRNLRNERKALTVTVNAADPFPEAPSQAAVEDVDMRFGCLRTRVPFQRNAGIFQVQERGDSTEGEGSIR